MKALIIEDEKNAREALIKIIKLISPESEIIGETGFVSEGLKLVKELKPDIVFLDIELEDGTGFDFLDKIENPDFKLIFVTAYNEFAIKAFKYSALDYLMKPIDPKELNETLERLKTLIISESEQKKIIRTLKENRTQNQKKLVLKTHNNTYFLSTNEIFRIEADGAYTVFYTSTQKIVVSKNLKYYENLLDNSFLRCHQSHIVNINSIIRIDKNDNLVLSNSHLVPVSSRKKAETLSHLKGI